MIVDGGTSNTSVSGLRPFSRYLVVLEAENGVGGVASPAVGVTTRQAAPAGLGAFTVQAPPSGTSIILTWDPPTPPYGVVTVYRVYDLSQDSDQLAR